MSISEERAIHRDSTFYFTFVIFKVDDCLFKVNRAPFETSTIFRDMFTMPPGGDRKPEGLVDENPIVLPGVTIDIFRKFLSLLFPAFVGPSGSRGETDPLDSDSWISILRLAQKWEFVDIISLALANLRKFRLGPVTKLEIAEDYDVNDWAKEAWKEILERKKPLSVDESERLGIKRATKVAHAREALLTIKMRQSSTSSRHPKASFTRASEVAQMLLHCPEHASLDEVQIVSAMIAGAY